MQKKVKEKERRRRSTSHPSPLYIPCIAWWHTLSMSIVQSIDNPSSKAIVCEWVCVFVCSQTPPKQLILFSRNFEGWFPSGDADGFRLKNIRICWTISKKIKKSMYSATLYDHYTLHVTFSSLLITPLL